MVSSSSTSARVPLIEYRHAPFFGLDDMLIGHLIGATIDTIDPSPIPSLYIHDEVDVKDGAFINGASVLRLALDRGDFPYSHIEFEGFSGSGSFSEHWTYYLLANPETSKILTVAGIKRLMRTFRKFTMEKDRSSLIKLILRWSKDSHTFITGWGEFTITLEDVCELCGLKLLANTSFTGEAFEDEDGIVEHLEKWYKEWYSYLGLAEKAHKSSFAQWQKYCFKDLRGATKKDERVGRFNRKKEGPALNE